MAKIDYNLELQKYVDYTDHMINYHATWKREDGVLNWVGSDNPTRFVNNQKTKLKVLLDYYDDKDMEYHINSHNCRSKLDFTEVEEEQYPVDIFIGCSHTFGTGHLWEHTYPYFVSKETGNIIINLGAGGSGIEYAFNRLLCHINTMNVKNVFHFQPIYSRWLVRHDNRFKHILQPEDEQSDMFFTQDYVIDNHLDYGAIAMNYYKSIQMIRQTCNDYRVPYFYSDGADWLRRRNKYKGMTMREAKQFIKDGDVAARDLMHFPLSWQKEIAEKFKNMLWMTPMGNIDSVLDPKITRVQRSRLV